MAGDTKTDVPDLISRLDGGDLGTAGADLPVAAAGSDEDGWLSQHITDDPGSGDTDTPAEARTTPARAKDGVGDGGGADSDGKKVDAPAKPGEAKPGEGADAKPEVAPDAKVDRPAQLERAVRAMRRDGIAESMIEDMLGDPAMIDRLIIIGTRAADRQAKVDDEFRQLRERSQPKADSKADAQSPGRDSPPRQPDPDPARAVGAGEPVDLERELEPLLREIGPEASKPLVGVLDRIGRAHAAQMAEWKGLMEGGYRQAMQHLARELDRTQQELSRSALAAEYPFLADHAKWAKVRTVADDVSKEWAGKVRAASESGVPLTDEDRPTSMADIVRRAVVRALPNDVAEHKAKQIAEAAAKKAQADAAKLRGSPTLGSRQRSGLLPAQDREDAVLMAITEQGLSGDDLDRYVNSLE